MKVKVVKWKKESKYYESESEKSKKCKKFWKWKLYFESDKGKLLDV